MVTKGDIVLYRLTSDDAEQVNRRRVPGAGHGEGWPAGAQSHHGNHVKAGDVCPMVVVEVFNDIGKANGQVLLDGNDTLWVTSVVRGDVEGTYSIR